MTFFLSNKKIIEDTPFFKDQFILDVSKLTNDTNLKFTKEDLATEIGENYKNIKQ